MSFVELWGVHHVVWGIETSPWYPSHERYMITTKAHHLGEFMKVGHMFGKTVSIPLLDQDEVNPGAGLLWPFVGGAQFSLLSVQGGEREGLQEVLKGRAVTVVGANDTALVGSKVNPAHTMRLMVETGVEVPSNDPAVSTRKTSSSLADGIPNLLSLFQTVGVTRSHRMLVYVEDVHIHRSS